MSDFVRLLGQFAAAHPVPSDAADSEQQVQKEFALLASKHGHSVHSSSESSISSEIPPFYFPPPAQQSFLDKLSREARTRYLERRAEEILDDRDLFVLWDSLVAGATEEGNSSSSAPRLSLPSMSSESSSPNHQNNSAELKINYTKFLEISHKFPPNSKFHRYFDCWIFSRFPRSPLGEISIRQFYRYILRKVQYTRIRISLTCYDEFGTGSLQEHDVENFVYDQLPALPALAVLDRDFYPYYVFTAVRKFFFFLDPHKRGRIKIKEFCSSTQMLEFDELRVPKGNPHIQLLGTLPYNEYNHLFQPATAGSVDPGRVGATRRRRNWFSAQSTQDVYAIYLGLDSNQNGMLSKVEFSRFAGGSLTNAFIDGLFSTVRMYPNKQNELEMDYKTFLDFILAMEYKQSPASLEYFFHILDISQSGYLDLFTIHYWFRGICQKMNQLGHESPSVIDVTNEIFDMAGGGREKTKITLEDLKQCKCGHTIISILIDVNGFWKYDNRETLMHQEQNEETG